MPAATTNRNRAVFRPFLPELDGTRGWYDWYLDRRKDSLRVIAMLEPFVILSSELCYAGNLDTSRSNIEYVSDTVQGYVLGGHLAYRLF
jgi:hypothetical protein